MDFRSPVSQLGVPIVTQARTLTVAAPLTGGGDLSANRSLGLAHDTTLQVVSGQLGVSSEVSLSGHTHTFAALTGKPTTLSGYGITDAQPLDADLTAIAALGYTATAFLKKTAANSWALDTATYLTANQTITLSGDASGSGTTAIAVTLPTVATAGTYRSVTVDAKGRVTAGTNPTTAAAYGITDAITTYGGQIIAGNLSVNGSVRADGGLYSGSAYFIGMTTGGLYCNGLLSATYFTTTGGSAGYNFSDRTTSASWAWYASGGYARLWTSSDVAQISVGGNWGIRRAAWSSATMYIQSVGNTTSSYGLIITDSGANNLFYLYDSGAAWLKGALTQNSDRRLKDQIADIPEALSLITRLRPRSFVMRDAPEQRRFGLIAQEALDVVPELITWAEPPQEEPRYTMDYLGLIAPLVGAVQALAARVEALEHGR